MKHIIKGQEPRSLVEHRVKSSADYDNYPDKDGLRAVILSDQGHICCYCMQRISSDKMKIEHWRCQDKYPESQLDFSNLLGACEGSEGFPDRLQHCDTSKGNAEITINPLSNHRNCEDLIRYTGDGKIYSDDETINEELNTVLNLNIETTFVVNRRNTLQLAMAKLKREYPRGTWTKAILNREIQKWINRKNNGKYEPYCQMVIYHLRKKLSSINSS